MKVKKLIAPIVITTFLFFYFIGYVVVVFLIPIPIWIKLIGALISLVLIGISIFVLIERINEIRSGEEDDLSKY